MAIPPSYLDVGMRGHLEGYEGCKVVSDLPCRQKQFFTVLGAICLVLTHDILGEYFSVRGMRGEKECQERLTTRQLTAVSSSFWWGF
mgnify:CR=1 FL=1